MHTLHLEYIDEIKNGDGEVVSVSYKIPERFNFAYDVVDRIAKSEPGRRAMLWVGEDGTERTVSFGEISAESSKIAAMLAARGVKKGDKVMLVLKRHFEFWPSILACHKLGAAAIPATNQLAAKDILYRLSAASVSAAICTVQDGFPGHFDEALAEYEQSGAVKNGEFIKFAVGGEVPGWLSYEEERGRAPEFAPPSEPTENCDTMLIYFTSGTSGMPKMVAHNFLYPMGHIATAKYWHKVDPDGLHLTISETGWAKSVWGKLYGQWFLGAGIFVYDFNRFDSDTILRAFSKYGITTFCAPPTMFRFFIKEDLSKYDFSTLSHVTIAGEALNPEVYEQFGRATGLTLFEGYGQTESTLTVFNAWWTKPRPGSMGKPSPAYDALIADESGRETDPGQTGEIVLRVRPEDRLPGLFDGYFRDGELTASVWHDGLYHTGDTAWRDEDGYFWYVGRLDDVIKSSGYRIGPFEVESVIMEHPAVLECAVTPAPDPVRGQVVKATIVPAKGYEPSEELKASIQNYVKTHTAPYKYPRIIEFVTELPKTISGKIRRTEIRARDAE